MSLPNELQEAWLTGRMDGCVSLSSLCCWQRAENDDLLGELLFTPCPRWIKIKLEVYELRCLSWQLYELCARLAVIYVYSSAGREKKPKNKWSSLKSYSNAVSTATQSQRGMMGDGAKRWNGVFNDHNFLLFCWLLHQFDGLVALLRKNFDNFAQYYGSMFACLFDIW